MSECLRARLSVLSVCLFVCVNMISMAKMGEKKRHKKKKKWRAKKFLTTQTVSLCGRRNRTKREREKEMERDLEVHMFAPPSALSSSALLWSFFVLPNHSSAVCRRFAPRRDTINKCALVCLCEPESGRVRKGKGTEGILLARRNMDFQGGRLRRRERRRRRRRKRRAQRI